jgi:hypothetical protein
VLGIERLRDRGGDAVHLDALVVDDPRSTSGIMPAKLPTPMPGSKT